MACVSGRYAGDKRVFLSFEVWRLAAVLFGFSERDHFVEWAEGCWKIWISVLDRWFFSLLSGWRLARFVESLEVGTGLLFGWLRRASRFQKLQDGEGQRRLSGCGGEGRGAAVRIYQGSRSSGTGASRFFP